jgi:hypothetical protein
MDYFWLILKHKWYILLAYRTLAIQGMGNIPLWRVLKHDVSKFSRAEYSGYQQHFFGIGDDPKSFAYAWLHHENHNSHHWGYWIPQSGKYAGIPLEMPESDVREMIVDWLAAGRAYEGSWDISDWLRKNLTRITLHPKTKIQVVHILASLGYHKAEVGLFKVAKYFPHRLDIFRQEEKEDN